MMILIYLISLLLKIHRLKREREREREGGRVKGHVLLFSHSVASSQRTSWTERPLSLQPAAIGRGQSATKVNIFLKLHVYIYYGAEKPTKTVIHVQ